MQNVQQILDQKGHRIISVTPETPVLEMVRIMAQENISAVLVMNQTKIEGIATERDYARKVVLQDRSSATTPVSVIMSHPVKCVSPQHTAQDCMNIMTEQRIRHLPVRDDTGIIGMVSIGDLVKAVIEDQQHEIRQLQQYISS
jgi:CBS domain-containing protein